MRRDTLRPLYGNLFSSGKRVCRVSFTVFCIGVSIRCAVPLHLPATATHNDPITSFYQIWLLKMKWRIGVSVCCGEHTPLTRVYRELTAGWSGSTIT